MLTSSTSFTVAPMLPSSTELRYFLEAAQCPNFSQAAQRLGISQPSLTTAMQRLEYELGVKLFHRSSKGVELTTAGRKFAAQAAELFEKWKALKKTTRSSVEDVEGHVQVGCHPSVSMYALPRAIANLMHSFPKLEVSLTHDLSRKITDEVIQMRLDLGIVVNPHPHPDLVLKKLGTDEVCLWEKRSGKIPDVLIYEPDLMQSKIILKKLKQQKIQFSRTLPSSNLEVIAKLTEAGAGFGILPSRVIQANVKSNEVQRTPKTPVAIDEIYLILRTENRHVAKISECAKIFSALFSP